MKIAYLLGSLNRGGTETLMLDVFRNSTLQGLDAMGVYRRGGEFEQDFLKSGINVLKISVGKNFISYWIHLRNILVGNKINIIHAQQPIDALHARIASIGTGMQIVLTLHGYDFKNYGIEKYILNYIIKRTDINIFVSDSEKKHYQNSYQLDPLKQRVVYNGISFDKFLLLQDENSTDYRIQNSLREELHLSKKTLLIGTVGNFNEVRDPLTLCRFLHLMNQQQVDFHFVFIGKKVNLLYDIYENCVNFCKKNGLKDNVSFLGSRNDVPNILGQLDAFLYASDHDTFGIAVVEAMAAGLPVFVNDWEVMKEITEDGKYATLYKTKDEKDLLQEFMLFLQNKAAYQSKAKKAAVFVHKKYSIESHIRELINTYREIIKNHEIRTKYY